MEYSHKNEESQQLKLFIISLLIPSKIVTEVSVIILPE